MMGVFSIEGLVAAIWVSAALATPLIAEPLQRRDDELCPPTYTTKNGLNFTSYCDKNNPNNDAQPPFLVDSMQDCMEYCSRYAGDNEGCFGVVWREDKNCWLRTSNTTAANMIADSNIHSALIVKGNMDPLDTTCPESDLSTHTLDSAPGIGYTVHCGKTVDDYDTCWEGYPACLDKPYMGFYHATSLLECLETCVNEHPLCRAVSYNPGLAIGFANCWPKTGYPNTLTTADSNASITHSATITSLDRIDTTCPDSNTYNTADNKAFEIQCGKVNAGTNITATHTQNVTTCMDLCATNDKGCIGVVFDSSLFSGYNNCYLQNTTNVITDQASATYALLTGSSVPKSSPSSSPTTETKKSSSKAWIAGPVIGGIVGIALVVAAVFFFRRKSRNASVAGGGIAEKGTEDHYDHEQASPTYGGYAPPPMQHHGNYGTHNELGDSGVRELAAGSAKYAHGEQEPQELA